MKYIIVFIIFLFIIIIINNLFLVSSIEKFEENSTIDIINQNIRTLNSENNTDILNESANDKKRLQEIIRKLDEKISEKNTEAEGIIHELDHINGYTKIQNRYCPNPDIEHRYDTLKGCSEKCSNNENCFSFSYNTEHNNCQLTTNCYYDSDENLEENVTLYDYRKRNSKPSSEGHYSLYIKDPHEFPMKNYGAQIGKMCNEKSFERTGNVISQKQVDNIKDCAEGCQNNEDCISFEYNFDNNNCTLNKLCYNNSGYQCVVDVNEYICNSSDNGSQILDESTIIDYNSGDSDNYLYNTIKDRLENISRLKDVENIKSDCHSICQSDSNCKGYDYNSEGCRFSTSTEVNTQEITDRRFCTKPLNSNLERINLYTKYNLGKKKIQNVNCNICEVDAIPDNYYLQFFKNITDNEPNLTFINSRNNIGDLGNISPQFKKLVKSKNTSLQIFKNINFQGEPRVYRPQQHTINISDIDNEYKNFKSFKLIVGDIGESEGEDEGEGEGEGEACNTINCIDQVNAVVNDYDSYTTYKYITNGSITLNKSINNLTVLLVGGGGGGSPGTGGGGGVIQKTLNLNKGTYNITVGNGGSSSNNINGGNTKIFNDDFKLQVGGGGGGCCSSMQYGGGQNGGDAIVNGVTINGGYGGIGGPGYRRTTMLAKGGNSTGAGGGGSLVNNNWKGYGGGAGTDSTSNGPGDGISVNILGRLLFYGGGGSYDTKKSIGGGGSSNSNPEPNSGGGAGTNSNGTGNGADGIVIIKVPK